MRCTQTVNNSRAGGELVLSLLSPRSPTCVENIPMFTRHFNPHQLSAAVQTISRRELTWDDNDSNGLELDVTKDDALAKLDSLLKRSLNTSYTFEDIETPRKRRKVEGLLPEEAESKAEAVCA